MGTGGMKIDAEEKCKLDLMVCMQQYGDDVFLGRSTARTEGEFLRALEAYKAALKAVWNMSRKIGK